MVSKNGVSEMFELIERKSFGKTYDTAAIGPNDFGGLWPRFLREQLRATDLISRVLQFHGTYMIMLYIGDRFYVAF
jgi:hypothetical protein